MPAGRKREQTVAELFGPDVAEQLAMLAIDVGCSVAVKRTGYATSARVPWSWIEQIREVMTAAGMDWQSLVAEREQRARRGARRRKANYRKGTHARDSR